MSTTATQEEDIAPTLNTSINNSEHVIDQSLEEPLKSTIDLESQRKEQEINKLKNFEFYPTTINWNVIGNFSGIQKEVRAQLFKVYLTLCATLFFTSLGSLFYLFIYQIHPMLSFLLSISLVVYLSFKTSFSTTTSSPNSVNSISLNSEQQLVSFLALFAFGFFTGTQLGPLLESVIEIDSSIIVFASVATSLIFLSFSIFAHYSKRRSLLFLGGTAFSILSILCWTLLFSFIFPFGLFGLFEMLSLYGGLLMFILFVIVDTQIIIERCNAGDKDTVKMSLQLFIDFIGIFVRILRILSKKRRN
ncbi:hypothetical protein ABK040_016135 [Willaertia magna]